MEELLNQTLLGNTLKQYLVAAALFLGGIIIIWVFKTIILSRLKIWAEKTQTTIDDFIIIGIRKSVVPLLYFAALYIGLKSLTLSQQASNVIEVISVIVITFFAVRLITTTLNYSINQFVEKQESGDVRGKQIKGFSGIINLVVWALGIIFLLDNLGIEISTIIAGLGISGIAVALAAQAILGDLFSSFVIFFDRPFEVGDFIVVQDKMGSVEHVGIKTTRLRALGGEQLVFSNTDLTNARIHNYKKMERRRIVFRIGVIYQTELEKLKRISEIVKNVIEQTELTEYDRGHFASFGPSSMDFEFVYFVLSSEYKQYMETQQKINLAMVDAFRKEGIEFAYPTQTLFLNKDESDYSSKEAA